MSSIKILCYRKTTVTNVSSTTDLSLGKVKVEDEQDVVVRDLSEKRNSISFMHSRYKIGDTNRVNKICVFRK